MTIRRWKSRFDTVRYSAGEQRSLLVVLVKRKGKHNYVSRFAIFVIVAWCIGDGRGVNKKRGKLWQRKKESSRLC